MEIAVGDDDVGAIRCYALAVGAPFAGDLDRGLDGLGTGVHRQYEIHAGQVGEVPAERTEAVVVKRPAGQGEAGQLFLGSGRQPGVGVAEVEGRVSGQAVQVAAALDIGDPGALAGGQHHGQGA